MTTTSFHVKSTISDNEEKIATEKDAVRMNHDIVVIVNGRTITSIAGSMNGITKHMFNTRINQMEIRALNVVYVGGLKSLLVLLDITCCSDSKNALGSIHLDAEL